MTILPFLDRESELAKLRAFAEGKPPSLAILYGRRRCGKSRLLQEFARGSDLYFLADKQDAALQRERLASDAAKRLPGLDKAIYPSWESILTQIDLRTASGSCLILDEFPYLAGTSPELPSVIQRLLDSGQLRNLHLVLCGSSQRMMLNLAMGAQEPLYGRSRLALKIRPLECGWIRKALGLKGAAAIEAYATLGGTPRYWELATSYPTPESLMKELLLSRDGILHDEMRRLLLDDVGDSTLPISILSLIGNGCHRLSEIASRLGKPATQLTRPVSNLVELGYVRRETPFGEHERKTKRSLYKLSDPYLAFAFRYIEPNRSRLEMGATEQVYREIAPQLPHHFASVWEDLARASTSRIRIADTEWQPAQRWWRGSRDGEIDLVCESADGSKLLVGEAKWAEKVSSPGVLADLQAKANALPRKRGQEIVFALWSKRKSGASGALHCISPKNVLDALV